MQDGLCTLAMCLYMEKHNKELEKLLPITFTDESSIDSYMWIVLAFVCYSNSNYSKALCLAQKVFIFFIENCLHYYTIFILYFYKGMFCCTKKY